MDRKGKEKIFISLFGKSVFYISLLKLPTLKWDLHLVGECKIKRVS